MEKLQLWDYIRNLCGDKIDYRFHPDFNRTYKRYMINKVLSMSPKTCHLALLVSQRPDMPKDMHHLFFNNELDKDTYFQYAKAEFELSAAELLYMMEYFECSKARAVEYSKLLSKKQFDIIMEIYKRRDDKNKGKLKKSKK